MITLTRQNGTEFVLNCDLIEMVEATPDTTIRLTTKNYHIVAETMEEVIDKVTEFKRNCNDLYGRLGR